MKLLNIIKHFLLPFFLLSFALFGFYFFDKNMLFLGFIRYWDLFSILTWLCVTWIVNRSIFRFFFRGYLLLSKQKPIPSLLEDVTLVIVWITSTLIFLSLYFDYNLTGLWATFSVTIAVFGFALRGMLADIFSGIAMGIERSFEVGDWIETSSGIVGKVTLMNWRATRVEGIDNKITIIPNSLLSHLTFKNYGNGRAFREEVEIELDYSITSNKAERILNGAATLLPELQKGYKKPDTKIKEFGKDGVKWQLRFWLNDYEKRDSYIYQVQKNILKNLRFSGAKIPIGSKSLECDVRDDVVFLLKEIAFFKDLTEEEISFLSFASVKQLITQGSDVIIQGEDGDSFFLLLEGVLSVLIKKDDSLIEVAKIGPGGFFGEMSLLTGTPRSATIRADVDSIIYEIKQEHLKPIIQARSKIIDSLSTYLHNRESENETKLQENIKPITKDNTKENIVSKLKKIFFDM